MCSDETSILLKTDVEVQVRLYALRSHKVFGDITTATSTTNEQFKMSGKVDLNRTVITNK